jgi:hypothetical protein
LSQHTVNFESGATKTVNTDGASPEVRVSGISAGSVSAAITVLLKNGTKLPNDKTIYVALYASNTQDALIDGEADTAAVTDPTAAEQEHRLALTDGIWQGNSWSLTPNTQYYFRLYYMDDGSAIKYFYDSAYPNEDGHYYMVRTTGAVDIGGAQSSVTYDPVSYTDKAIKLSYSLSQTLGFRVYYSIKVLDGPYAGVYTDQDLRSGAANGMLPPGAETARQQMNVRFGYTEGNRLFGKTADFWASGTGYEITAVVSTNPTHTGIPGSDPGSELGVNTFAFTMPPLGRSGFTATATPSLEAGDYRLAVRTLSLDPDRVIVNGAYRVRIFDGGNGDATPDTVRNAVYTVSNGPDAALLFEGLEENSAYTLRWYAAENTANAVNPGDAADLPDAAFLYGNREYVVYELKASTTDSHGIYVGRVTAAAGGSGRVKLTFDGSVNIGDVGQIQYSVYNAEPAPNGSTLSGRVPFSPDAAGGRYEFELPPALRDGDNTITLSFYDAAGNYINQPVTVYYRR